MMGTMARTLYRAVAVLSLGLLSGLAFAQDSEPYAADPPDRAARLSFITGDVSLQPAGESDWAPAIVNRPLTTGDKLWTDRDSRAEIYVGPAAIRLDGNTGFSFLNVDDDTIQMRVTAGIINVNVRTLDGGEHIEIDTPNVAVSLLRAGNYRVEVDDAGDVTVLKVSEGSAQVTGPTVDTIAYAQQVVTIRGTDDLLAQYGTLGAPDDFDSWSLERDRRDEEAANSRTAEYVSPDVTGYQDLENNGTWYSEPEYGYVWAPRVAVGWAPYQFGRWLWVSPWGWTWIDDSRWGYAPFHYGRWAYARNRWCWVPGPRHVRAVYAPALVGWGGSHGGNVSWFPLGPREVYVPGRHFSRRYLERVNFTNTDVSRALITRAYENRANDGIYRNRVVPGGVTAVPRAAFTSAGRTGAHRVRVSEQDQAGTLASALAPQIAPVRESRMGGPTRNVRAPPRSVADRQVVVRRDPPPVAARFARRPLENRDVARVPDRMDRPQNRVLEPRQPDVAATLRDRGDRPPAVDRPPRDRPVSESAPPTRSSVFDRQALSDRVRVDRDRQVREGQQQREALQEREALQQRENSQQREAQQQRWQRLDEQARQQREQSQVSRELHDQLRERVQRQQEAERPVQRERNYERPQVEQRQVERRQPERPQVERSPPERRQAERPQVERPQAERPNRSEARPPAESRPQPRNREDGNTRSKRD
jgi:hypothetical protein